MAAPRAVHTMLKALRLSDAAVFTVPMENISWLKRLPSNACFIPVGANLPTSGMPAQERAFRLVEN